MSRKPNDKQNPSKAKPAMVKQSSKTDTGKTRFTVDDLYREYQRQIEVFEVRNRNGAYDAILEYLREECYKIRKNNQK